MRGLNKQASFEWEAEKRLYEAIYHGLLHKKNARVLDSEMPDELGYTMRTGDIYLAYKNPYIDALPKKERPVFRMGVFAHELMHQFFTDFDYTGKVVDAIRNRREQKVAMFLINVIEDPAIEYFAGSAVSGDLLKALRFSIGHIYQMSPAIDPEASGFEQVSQALIHFGDLGIIKGHITDEEALPVFMQAAPLVNQAILEPDGKKRIDIAMRVKEILRPLWEKDEQCDETIEHLQSANGMGESQGQGSQEMDTSEMSGTESPESQRRNEAAEQMAGAGSDDDSDQQSGTQGEGSGRDGSDSDGKDSSSGSSADSSSEEENGMKKDGKPGSGSSGDGSTDEKSSGEDSSGKDAGIDEAEANKAAESMKEGADELAKKIKADIAKRGNASQRHAARIDYEYDLNASVQRYPNVTVKNETAVASGNEYYGILAENRSVIVTLTKQLRALFQRDIDTTVRATSGKYNIKRGSLMTNPKVFDKRREAQQVSDMAVMLLVDESGSMAADGRYLVARSTAAILAETMAALNIPCAVIGFTADYRNADVYHQHYTTWKNTPAERQSIAGIKARANNFDGYSIRYAAALLAKKRADHKLLFVISDGLPACRYYTRKEGVNDTTAAIAEAKHVATVFGVGISNDSSDTQTMQHMYKNDFVTVSNVKDMPLLVAKQLKQVLKSWM